MKQQDINFVTQMIAMLDDEASLLTALNRTGKHNQRLQQIKVLKQDYINYLRSKNNEQQRTNWTAISSGGWRA